jgi:hypothetical protein
VIRALCYREKSVFKKISVRHWQQILNWSFGPLPTAICSKKRPLTELCALFRILIAYSCTRWCRIFKGLSQDWGGTDYSETSAPLPFEWDHFLPDASRWTVPLKVQIFRVSQIAISMSKVLSTRTVGRGERQVWLTTQGKMCTYIMGGRGGGGGLEAWTGSVIK